MTNQLALREATHQLVEENESDEEEEIKEFIESTNTVLNDVKKVLEVQRKLKALVSNKPLTSAN